MSTSLAMVVALSKKYTGSGNSNVDVESVKGLQEELNKKFDTVDITSDGIDEWIKQ